VTRSSDALTACERIIRDTVDEEGFEPVVIDEQLTPLQQEQCVDKRHPVDPMGAAGYIIGDSVESDSTGYAYRSAMAPVIVYSTVAAERLGARPGERIDGGGYLSFRDPLDPPESMLDNGLPRACGARIVLDTPCDTAMLREVLEEV
jgi:hypothetical protein